MTFIADLHTHSHFSRATSRNLDPEHLALWAKKKGITVVGTGDFTHAGWVSELQEKLVEAENGLYRLKPELEEIIKGEVTDSCQGPTRFLLSGEISCIYKKNGRTRKLHHLILMPDIGAVSRMNERLSRIGNLSSDGRPILGLDSKALLEIVLEASERAFFIPAHIWTPWFSLFGSKSGFDSLEECFEDLTPHICALETGLSSDPPMNRRLSALDNYILVSNSDAHSPSKLGREANIFNTELDYGQMVMAMSRGDGFQGTIEFFPEEGKYHLDGHRKCQVRLNPMETNSRKGICPSCGKGLTIGVLHRVDDLSDRNVPELSKDFYSLVPLTEILSELFSCGPSTKKVTSIYEDLLAGLGPELQILMDLPIKDIELKGGILLAKAIDRMRRNQVIRLEGYDGEYGLIHLFDESEISELAGQKSLFRSPEKPVKKSMESPMEKSIEEPPVELPPRYRKRPRGEIQFPREIEKDSTHEHAVASDPILDLLNPAQREAVLHRDGHLLIVAGPGTGKTMALSHRVAHLIASGQAAPSQFLALTFTNKAAKEMGERINALIDRVSVGEVQVVTFHGFCLNVLRDHGERLNLPSNFGLCSEYDVSVLAQQIMSEASVGKKPAARFLKKLSQLKMVSAVGKKDELSQDEHYPLFQKYQQRLRELGMLDLDDLEVETLRLFQHHPEVCQEYAERFPMVFVDEYQDTNSIQVALLKALVSTGDGEICAIGDPDQAIYGFRGADVQNFHSFAEDFPGATRTILNKNYRSTQIILHGSSALMGKEKPLEGGMDRGDIISLASCETHPEEAEMVVEQIEKLIGGTTYFSLDSGRVSSHEEGENLSFSDMAVLFRLNSQGDAFEEAFRRAGIPYIRSGEKPLIRQYPANIIWRFFQALKYPDSDFHLNTYFNLLDTRTQNGEEMLRECKIGGTITELVDQAVAVHAFDLISAESIEVLRRMKEIAEAFNGDMGAFLDALSLERGIDHVGLSGDRVALMSLHAAKGLEWPVVFITGCEDKLIPCTLFGDRDEAEEKRLLYVGMTRARLKLILSHARRRKINGRMLQMKPSPFLDLIPEEICGPLERAKWKRKGKAQKQLELF
jgi:DNA helicase-2/ATP-dependent DNA helicase PcrA